MYMSVPSRPEESVWKKDNKKLRKEQLQTSQAKTLKMLIQNVLENICMVSLMKTLSLLENKLSGADYTKIWRELRHTGSDLDQLYEDCKNGTFLFKQKYDNIKKTKQTNDALRQTYYYALTDKMKHEEDRDAYFKCDEDLARMKEEIVEETQELALKNSKYIEYNQRFATKREELITHMLSSVNQVQKENAKHIADKERLAKELADCRNTIHGAKEELKLLQTEKNSLTSKCQTMEQKTNQLKKEVEWILRQNNKLKEANSRLDHEVNDAEAKIQELVKESESHEARQQKLLKENGQLMTKYEQTKQVMESLRIELATSRIETKKQRQTWEEEMSKIKEEVIRNKKLLEEARANNRRTLMRNQALREKLSSTNHKLNAVTRDNVRTTLKEYKTRKQNAEMASAQLGLVNEVIELKNDFFRDQGRIREGARINHKLEKNIKELQRKVYLLKENPSALDPLDGAQDLKQKTLKKFSGRTNLT